jgi:hypothetical protein
MLRTAELARGARVTNTPGHSIGAYVTWNGDRIGLAWCDDSDQAQHEVFFQQFLVSGAPASAAVRLTHTRASSGVPVIKPWKSSFALAWNESEAAPDGGHGGGRSQIVLRVIDPSMSGVR